MEQIIYLEDSDDIAAIRNRIEFAVTELARQTVRDGGKADRPRLLLVVPRKNKALQSLVNVKLLARTARTRIIDLALVTNQADVRDYAREAGIKVFASVRSAKLTGWVPFKAPVASPEVTSPPVVGDKKVVKQKQKERKKKRFVVVGGEKRSGSLKYLAQQLGMLIMIVILALALVIGVIGLLPEATVTITPIAEPVEAELVVKADPNVQGVSFTDLTFPARIAQVELKLSGQIETVDTELTPAEKSIGQVTFINRTEDAHTIPPTTTLITGAGEPVTFVTVQTVTIPAGIGSTSTPTLVIAAEPGPKGNVGAGQINRFENPSLDLLARVINEEPTQGGVLAPAKIITEDDKPRLTAHLRQLVQQEGLAQLKAALGEQEFIPPESVQVIVLDVKYREFSGDFSDSFGGEMQAVVRATVVGGYNANRLALAALQQQVPPGYELDVEGLNFGAGEVLGFEEGITAFRIYASGKAVPVIDGSSIAQDVAWLPIGEAQEMLSRQYRLITVPGVDLQPEWLVEYLGRLPFSPFKINVIINEAVTPEVAESSQ